MFYHILKKQIWIYIKKDNLTKQNFTSNYNLNVAKNMPNGTM